jgi:tRNA isopentenyl-2-thiomethyl-A-37 hydroxylase MiaE
MLLWIFCILGWVLFGMLLYGTYRLDQHWIRQTNLVIKENQETTEKYNEIVRKYNLFLEKIEAAQREIQAGNVEVIRTGKKNFTLN